MRKCVFFILAVIAFSLNAYEITSQGDNILITDNDEELNVTELTIGLGRFTVLEMEECSKGDAVGKPDLPHFTKLLSLPNQGNWKIADISYDYEEMDLTYPVIPSGWEDMDEFSGYKESGWYPSETASIMEPQIMRDYRFSQLSIASVQYNPKLNRARVLRNIELHLTIDSGDMSNPYTGRELPYSRAFAKIAEAEIFGIDNTRNTNDYAGSLLIICPSSAITYAELLAEWKRQLGFRTEVRTTSQTGTSNTSLRNYIQNAYNSWEFPPDHVMFIGDESGSYIVPAYYCEGYMHPYCVTDHDYTLFSGTDYFPDLLIGRLSVRSSTNLSSGIGRILNYESDPYMSNTNWYNKALMMSVIEDDWGSEYFSGRETVINVKEKLLDFTYTQVDTFIAPYQSSTSQLISLINTGYTFLNYRGFGSTYYWQGAYNGHMMETSHINQLSNGQMLPMVTSIVCGGGDFADDYYPFCFGETWVTAGSVSSPRGAIGFIGPSEHDTKTPFNNCNDMGIYQGITQEEIFGTSAMMLRGKMELYNNFPYCHGWGNALNSDQFYFYVYNLLGDPTINVWTDVPKECQLNVESEIVEGQNFVEVNVTSEDGYVENFIVSVLHEGELLAVGRTNQNGNAYIPLEMPQGEYTLTASSYGYIPAQEEIIISPGNYVGISNFSSDDTVIAGDTFELELTILNHSTSPASGVNISLANYDGKFIIIDQSQIIPNLAANTEEIISFTVEASSEWQDGEFGQIFCTINSSIGNSNGMAEFEIYSPQMAFSDVSITSSTGFLQQGESCSVNLELLNSGRFDSPAFTAELISLDNNAAVSQPNSSYNPINSGNDALANTSFEVLPANVITGQTANLQLNLYQEDEMVQTIHINIPVGDIDETSATFDSYGYMAIESDDAGDFEVPEYEWIEISPFAGGDGIHLTSPHMHETDDGWIDQVTLPFDFQYYGETFDRITVCQNGYFSFGETSTLFFRNKSIPSGYGPGGKVCPFWDDLEQGYVYYYHDEVNHQFILEWKNMRLVYNPSQRQYFQVILRDPEYYPTANGDGEIIFIYQEVNNYDANENYASVGIESPDATMGLQITFADIYGDTVHELDDERAILFTPVDTSVAGIMYGDVDANGAVEAFDASLALQYFVGIDPGAVAPLPWPEWRIMRSDVDGNGTIEAYDGSLILQYFVGIIDEFPVESARNFRTKN